MSARARVTSARSTRRPSSSASSHSGARARTSPGGSGDERSARENLPALAADQVRQRHEHAVLVGDVADQPLPAAHARRARDRRRPAARPARRRRRRNEDHLRAVERGDRRRQAVPRVLADEHRRAPPRRCRTRGRRARAPRSAPRRTARTSAGTSSDGRARSAARRRRASRTSRCCTACCSRARRTRASTSSGRRAAIATALR